MFESNTFNIIHKFNNNKKIITNNPLLMAECKNRKLNLIIK